MTMVEVESRLAALEAEVALLREQLENADIAAAMKQSVEEFERGEGKPAIEVAMALGRKYGIVKP